MLTYITFLLYAFFSILEAWREKPNNLKLM